MEEQFSSKSRWWLWCLLALSLATIDQTIKQAVSASLPLHASIQITPWFNWTHVLNPGAAFSFLADASGWQRHFFSAVGLLVSAILLFSLWRGVTNRLVTASYVSIVAGALGNVIDRVRIGAVVDYLDFHWGLWHWPAFNLADVLVVGGAIFLVLSSFTFPRNEMKQAT
ncbi:signal peptidase II [Allopusillimonas ginsengisoli]|nr:signal peptidase II [Allopusillimonas ginsengisoli]